MPDPGTELRSADPAPLRTDDNAIWVELSLRGPMTARALTEQRQIRTIRTDRWGPNGIAYDDVYARLKSMEKRGLVRRYPGGKGSRWKWEAVDGE